MLASKRLALLLTVLAPNLRAESEVAPPVVTASAGYTGEFWRNTRGGIETGNEYLDNLDLVLDYRPERLLGIEGAALHAHVIYNNGREFGRRIGEAQLVSNIEGVDTWRLYEFWLETEFGTGNRRTIRAGLYDLSSEYDVLDSAGLFINSSQGTGPQLAQTGENGPSIFPVTSVAIRLRQESDRGYWQFAVLDGVPGARDDPARTGLHFHSGEGVLLAAEFGGRVAGFDKLALGAWSYSARFDRLGEFDANGDPVHTRGNRGVYLIGEKALALGGGGQLAAFFRTGTAPGRFNPIESFIGTGIVWSGFAAARPDDQLGFSVATAFSSAPLRRSAGFDVATQETVLELTWRVPLNDWLTLQPDLQYVLNPGFDRAARSGFAIGLRFELAAERSWP